MTQEEFQKIVLKELWGIKEDVSSLKEDVNSLKEDMRDVKTRLQNVEHDVSSLREDVSGLKEDVNLLKGQVTENTSILKAVLHNQEFAQAKIEGLEKNTSSVQFTRALDERQRIHSESINLLASRQLRVEAEIEQLKKAQ